MPTIKETILDLISVSGAQSYSEILEECEDQALNPTSKAALAALDELVEEGLLDRTVNSPDEEHADSWASWDFAE